MAADSPAVVGLTGSTLAASDREHAFHRGAVRRVFSRQPGTNGSARQRRRGRREGLGIGGIESRCECIEQIGIGTPELGLAGQHGHQIALCQDVHQRQQLGAYSVAHMQLASVRWVVDGGNVEHTAQLVRLGPAQIEQRMAVRAHTAETIDGCATQQVEQHRLCLIIGGVSREGIWSEHRMACRACPCFLIRSGCHPNALTAELRTESIGCGSDDSSLCG